MGKFETKRIEKTNLRLDKIKLRLERLDNIEKSLKWIGIKYDEFLDKTNLIKRSEFINFESIGILNDIKNEIISYKGITEEEKECIKLIQSINSTLNDIKNIRGSSYQSLSLYEQTREQCIELVGLFRTKFSYVIFEYIHEIKTLKLKQIKLSTSLF